MASLSSAVVGPRKIEHLVEVLTARRLPPAVSRETVTTERVRLDRYQDASSPALRFLDEKMPCCAGTSNPAP